MSDDTNFTPAMAVPIELAGDSFKARQAIRPVRQARQATNRAPRFPVTITAGQATKTAGQTAKRDQLIKLAKSGNAAALRSVARMALNGDQTAIQTLTAMAVAGDTYSRSALARCELARHGASVIDGADIKATREARQAQRAPKGTVTAPLTVPRTTKRGRPTEATVTLPAVPRLHGPAQVAPIGPKKVHRNYRDQQNGTRTDVKGPSDARPVRPTKRSDGTEIMPTGRVRPDLGWGDLADSPCELDETGRPMAVTQLVKAHGEGKHATYNDRCAACMAKAAARS